MFANCLKKIRRIHGLRTHRGNSLHCTARPKIQSQSQTFRYGRGIFCLPHRPNFSDIFDLCLHWVSVVRGYTHDCKNRESLTTTVTSGNVNIIDRGKVEKF